MLKRLPLAILLVGATSAWAQQVISAHSGVIHFVEGTVTLDGKAVAPKFAEFPDVKNGQTLAAEDGRAEVLLTPGVILRIAENSSFQMVSNSRSDTRLSVLTGSALIEVGELLASNAITVLYNDAHIELVKKGLYRIDSDPGKLRVYDGEARVTATTQTLVARKGREVLLGAVLDMSGFDVKESDAFMRWASRRSEQLAQANVSSARTASGMGYTGSSYGSGYGYGLGGGSWAYNPWYSMFTYMPYGNNMYYSPFGFPFYSPSNIGYFVPSGFSGSAFPITASTMSPHYNGSGTGSGASMAPRGSYGGSNSGTAATGAARSSSLSNGGMSSGSSASSSAPSSGASAHAGGGMGGARGK
jgi:FecR protein